MLKEWFEISRIIADYLSQKIGKADFKKLQKWISLSDDNRELFNRVITPQYQEEKGKKLRAIDIEEAWEKLAQERPQLRGTNGFIQQRISHNKNKTIYLNIAKIAAAVIILAGGLYLITTERGSVTLKAPVFESHYEAQLKLSDGRVVDLTAIEGAIQLSKSEKIENSSNLLIYSGDNKTEEPVKLEYNEVSVSFGKGYKILLSDGTTVHLNSLSKIKFPVKFSNQNREIFLEGEAYFEVAKESNRPFIVNSGDLQVKVLGTSFNISSYTDENLFQTTLVEGAVKISGSGIEEQVLSPNEQFSYNKISREATKEIVDVSYYTLWKDGIFKFKDIRLEKLMKIVQRLYNVEVVFMEREIQDYQYGCNINRYEELDPILRIIEANGKLKVKIEGRKIIISKT